MDEKVNALASNSSFFMVACQLAKRRASASIEARVWIEAR
jgi:hypothetical protein